MANLIIIWSFIKKVRAVKYTIFYKKILKDFTYITLSYLIGGLVIEEKAKIVI